MRGAARPQARRLSLFERKDRKAEIGPPSASEHRAHPNRLEGKHESHPRSGHTAEHHA